MLFQICLHIAYCIICIPKDMTYSFFQLALSDILKTGLVSLLVEGDFPSSFFKRAFFSMPILLVAFQKQVLFSHSNHHENKGCKETPKILVCIKYHHYYFIITFYYLIILVLYIRYCFGKNFSEILLVFSLSMPTKLCAEIFVVCLVLLI